LADMRGGAADAAAAAGARLDWRARARLLFDAVDTARAGSVGADACAALARDVLDGAAVGAAAARGGGGAAMADFLRELADEPAAVREGAIEAEARDMMAWAHGDPPRLDFDGFARWLADFMQDIDDDSAAARRGGGSEGEGKDGEGEGEGEGEEEEDEEGGEEEQGAGPAQSGGAREMGGVSAARAPTDAPVAADVTAAADAPAATADAPAATTKGAATGFSGLFAAKRGGD
jgi:hypothetical protein